MDSLYKAAKLAPDAHPVNTAHHFLDYIISEDVILSPASTPALMTVTTDTHIHTRYPGLEKMSQCRLG
jgi:hypothetical protein